jgi:hypothetical protein
MVTSGSAANNTRYLATTPQLAPGVRAAFERLFADVARSNAEKFHGTLTFSDDR